MSAFDLTYGGIGGSRGGRQQQNESDAENPASSCFGNASYNDGCFAGGGVDGGHFWTTFTSPLAQSENSPTMVPPSLRTSTLMAMTEGNDGTTPVINEQQQGISSWAQVQFNNLWTIGSQRQPKHEEYNNGIFPSSLTTSAPEVTAVSRIDTGDDIAAALNQLTFQQREEVYDDIHGISDAHKQEEDPEMVERCVAQLKLILLNHVSSDQDGARRTNVSLTQENRHPLFGLQHAMNRNVEYVLDKSFLVSFLRADEWDVQLASKRMIKFFNEKLALFGVNKLTKDITIDDDLDQDDLRALEGGGMQYVPLQDRSGRHITVNVPGLESITTHQSILRAGYYVFMAVSKDNDQVQKQGLCELSYDIETPVAWKEKSHKMDFQLMRRIMSLRDALPIKTASRHIVTDDPLIEFALKITTPFVNSHTTVRTKIHTGSHMAVQYALLSYGIPVEALPIDSGTGEYHNRTQKVWVQHRRSVEATVKKQLSQYTEKLMTTSSIEETTNNVKSSSIKLNPKFKSESTSETSDTTFILYPEPNDVILGRGRPIDQHVGNVQFRQYLQSPEVLQEYVDTPKFLKFQNAEKIRQTLTERHNVRFLRENADCKGWHNVNHGEVREKILRTFRRILLTQQKQSKTKNVETKKRVNGKKN